MNELVTTLLYAALGFLSGSVLYCRFVPLLLLKKDICALSPDKNPGAANVFVHCGVPMGLLCLVLDMALRTLDPARLGFAAVMTAPVLGHALGLLNGGHGGKCIAVIFGVLIALLGITPLGFVLAGIYIFLAGIVRVRPNGRCSIFTFSLFALCALGMGIFSGRHAVTLGALILSAVSIVKHVKSAAALRAAEDVQPKTQDA